MKHVEVFEHGTYFSFAAFTHRNGSSETVSIYFRNDDKEPYPLNIQDWPTVTGLVVKNEEPPKYVWVYGGIEVSFEEYVEKAGWTDEAIVEWKLKS